MSLSEISRVAVVAIAEDYAFPFNLIVGIPLYYKLAQLMG